MYHAGMRRALRATDSGYRKHMETVRTRLAAAMDQTVNRLEARGITPRVVPGAGNAFSQSLSAGNFLRFNVAQSKDDRIFDVLAKALSR